MYGDPIPQPPHSAGQTLQGLRTHIDPSQVPSPVDAIEADRDKWENQTYTTLPGNHAPLSTSDYIALDQGNSSPKFVRMTTWNIPSTSRLANELEIPLAAIIQPFADVDPREEPVPLVECGPSGPQRCALCQGYINPWCTWTAGGSRWKCNLCGHETEVSAEYFCNLDSNFLRLDHAQRPELNKGTIDFAVSDTEAYWAPNPPERINPSYVSIEPPPVTPASTLGREPKPMDYLFAFDVSVDAVSSGFLRTACESLKEILYGEDSCFPSECHVGILTFHSELHFYDLSPSLDQANMLVVADIDEVFLPTRQGILVNPHRSRTVIENLLESISPRYEALTSTQSCLGSAVRATLATLAGRGGQVVFFQATLPTLGPGALQPRTSEAEMYGTDKEKTLFVPRDHSWQNVAEELAEEGIGVSMFLGMNKFVDVGSIGVVSSITGGELFFHPRFDLVHDRHVLHSQLRRLISRTTAYNCALRVRCSHGLRISSYQGNFHLPTPDSLEFGTMDADKSISVTLEHSGKLNEGGYAFLQCAVLYTAARGRPSPSPLVNGEVDGSAEEVLPEMRGERRVRVLNLAVQVAGLAGSVFRFADMDAVVVALLRRSIARMKETKLSTIREDLTEATSAILYAYRRNCAASTGATQLIIPEAFRALPMYALGIHKSKPFKARSVTSDVRNFHSHKLLALGVRATMFTLYPRMLALHDLDEAIALPQPVPAPAVKGTATATDGDGGEGEVVMRIDMPGMMRCSYRFMQAGGVYLIDNEDVMIFWIGLSASPALLMDLFGVDDVHSLDPEMISLPELPTRLSTQVRNVLAHRTAERGGRQLKIRFARQNLDGQEIEFSDLLVEDHNCGALSYMDYLSLVHKQIVAAIQNGVSLSTSTSASIRAPW
ncbi:protein transporter SEC24 [Stereum hirsutum FP-91666 SS1]|uniref:protein transporter SEC24 n=1 Tax=Stereum hirsutum (strain FP-91666) TaxID=721885 RepID=UPI000440F767|nr:protein transporter SEC24 [Stereum hirsutum FP-91666 SS1]EIM88784.1 protein transporter SEC24 [Stereum hirsutum FP-91666 SS1]